MVAALLAKPAVKYGLIVLAVLALVGGTLFVVRSIYSKGEDAGQSSVIKDVQGETIRKLDEARESKERTDEEVLRTPYDDRVDGLR